MNTDRSWMYERIVNGVLLPSFVEGLEGFITFACTQPDVVRNNLMKCPCNALKCRNRSYFSPETVREHVKLRGFVPKYTSWTLHGEKYIPFMDYGPIPKRRKANKQLGSQSTTENAHTSYDHSHDRMEEMIFNAGGPEFTVHVDVEEPPNQEAQAFYDMLEASKGPVCPGSKMTELSMVARAMSCKAEGGNSEMNFNNWLQLMKEAMPEPNLVPANFYQAQKKMRALGLPMEKIDCCPNMCMLYWHDDVDLLTCRHCGKERYSRYKEGAANKRQKKNLAHKKMWYFPLGPRLKRLYASSASADKMRWHKERVIREGEEDKMGHPADSPAWKEFDEKYKEFAAEPRNVRLGLCSDGFNPFGGERRYSCWPVMLTPYNLPPSDCMKEPFMFLTVLVPGPEDPGQKLDVFLQPLIKELQELWEKGIPAYDVSSKKNFTLRAALMWTVSDFPAYSMLSGRKTAGFHACPYCLEDSDVIRLEKSGKESWFDCHRRFLPEDHPFRKNKDHFLRNKVVDKGPPLNLTGVQILEIIEELGLMKVTEIGWEKHNARISSKCGWKKRSIFWDLPYWSSLLIRHMLDVMHIEKNVFENCFNTICNIAKKTKDTVKSREELGKYCKRPELLKKNAEGQWPKACYTLDKEARDRFFEWVKKLRFPDNYASKLGRCVDMKKTKMYGMKSHDCHVLLERVLPVAFKELLPKAVWNALTELSLFFKNLCTRVVEVKVLERLQSNIPLILCKLERIFPPSFFDSMEHLPVHLPYEALLAGPVQFRWMYPFERYLGKLKKYVNNKGAPEGSMANAYIREESARFCSYYFSEDVMTKASRPNRNADTFEVQHDDDVAIDIFRVSGRIMGAGKKIWLTDKEYKAAHHYILQNSSNVDPFMIKFACVFKDRCLSNDPLMTDDTIEYLLEEALEPEFPDWFKLHVRDHANNVTCPYIQALAEGPLRCAYTFSSYVVNGLRFQTKDHNEGMATCNSGVCVGGEDQGKDFYDFYGTLQRIVRVEYPGVPLKRTVLFECDWYDPTPDGTRKNEKYEMVEVNPKKKYRKYEPFILASQARQVVFIDFPSTRKGNKGDWVAAIHIQARSKVEYCEKDESITNSYQEEGVDGQATRPIDAADEDIRLHESDFIELDANDLVEGGGMT